MHINPDYLINIANVLILVAFAVRDVLLLRSLFLAGSVVALGFYYLQSPPLWSAIAWTVLYSVIHAYWIVRILLEASSGAYARRRNFVPACVQVVR